LEIISGIDGVDEASSNIAHSNVYLIVNGAEIIVIDTGTPGNAKKIVEYIQKLGHQPNEVSTIILTHYHMDHAGSVKELQELTGAKVAASQAEAVYINGTQPYPKPKNLLLRAANNFVKVAPVSVSITLKDGDKIGGLTVIEAPGHTLGSIFLYDPDRKALFSGDTLRLDGDKVTSGPKQYVWSEEKEKASIKRLANLDFEVLLPGHASYLSSGASRKVKELIGLEE
jgi:glyoxylase-like metal-dependent hydrolase (beta-lactamase superfamily II)